MATCDEKKIIIVVERIIQPKVMIILFTYIIITSIKAYHSKNNFLLNFNLIYLSFIHNFVDFFLDVFI